MAQCNSETAVAIEKLREFDRVATTLDIPRAERLNILNTSEQIYVALCSGHVYDGVPMRPELVRRLSYALPLMRRLAGNSPVQRKAIVN